MKSPLTFSILLIGHYLLAQPLALVNTAYDEQNPVISPDGQYMFFTISNHPQNVGSKSDPGDIWFSTKAGDQWTAPVHAGALLNDRAYNGVAGFSADGSQLFLLSHYDASGNAARTQGISVSKNNGTGWSKPENISIPYFQNKSPFHSGHLLNDVFVSSAETYGSRVEDIYVSTRGTDGKWSEPKNLGPKINTQFQELSPSLSDDGSTLYFSSNGRKGFGSFDIYSSSRLDDSWTNWSDPVNMGGEFNSDGRELFYRDYSALGITLFTSTKNSNVYGNIRLSNRKAEKDSLQVVTQIRVDTVRKIEEIIRTPESDKLIKVYGKVTNAKNGETINATLIFQSTDTTAKANIASGEYTVRIASTNAYDVKIDAPGFVSDLEKLNLNTYEMKELEMNFTLQPIEVGTTVTLKNVLFLQSKPELLPESYPELDLVVQFLKANSHLEIELAGHTDSRGSFRQLMTLSQQRVNRVKSYLVSKGISAKRIVGKGYGGSRPIASNDSEETRMLNRRVEFVIKKL
jgi:OmpA-OmpF porin, OOP family